MNNLENFHPQEQIGLLRQSRETLLRLGYDYIAFKSRLKKRWVQLKKWQS